MRRIKHEIFGQIGNIATLYNWQWAIILLLMLANLGWMYFEASRTIALMINIRK